MIVLMRYNYHTHPKHLLAWPKTWREANRYHSLQERHKFTHNLTHKTINNSES